MQRLVTIGGMSLLLTLFWGCNTSINYKESNEEMDGMEKAMRQEFLMTRDPQLNTVPRERMLLANSYMRTLETNRISSLTWAERGPNNVGGRTRTIMIDKRDATGNTVFAGSVSGGLFKTTNFTSASPNWVPINDFLPNLAITVLVQDNNNQNTMYAATGEGWFNVDAVKGAGVFKSTDGGTTWNQLPLTATFEYIQDFLIDNSGNLYISQRNISTANRGVIRSTDGGNSWTPVLGAPIPGFATGRASDMELASNGDIYAALGIFGRSVLMKSSFSLNGANTGALGSWIEITPVAPSPEITQRIEVMVAPSDPQRVYVIAQDSATSQAKSFFRSTDGGTTWTRLTAPPALNNGPNSQTWYNLIGAVDSNNPDIIVVGGLHLARSTDGGVNWQQITFNGGPVHVDHHALVFDGSSKLVNGNDGGIYYSSNIDAGSPTFTNKNNGYNVTQYYACDIHPTTVNYFLAGAQDNGTQKFTNPGINTTTNATGGDGGFCHIDQTDGVLQVTAFTANNYSVSSNSGGSFSQLSGINNNRGQFINPTDLDDNGKVLYCGDDAGKYFFISGLPNTPSGNVVTVSGMGAREVTAVKVNPFASNTIYLGASFGNVIPQIYKISNANTTSPTVVSFASVGSVANAAISCIDIDPADANHLVVTLSNFGVVSVFESTDGGVSFSSIEGNLPDMPIRWALFAPANAQLNGASGGNGGILLGTELGIWSTSVIAGTSTQWAPNNTGLANVRTDMLKYRAADNVVVAATHGRGLYTTTLPTVVTGVSNNVITKDFIKYVSSSQNELLIVTGTLQTQKMQVQIFTMNGQQVYQSDTRYQRTAINTSKLPSGAYLVKLVGNNKEHYFQKFIK